MEGGYFGRERWDQREGRPQERKGSKKEMEGRIYKNGRTGWGWKVCHMGGKEVKDDGRWVDIKKWEGWDGREDTGEERK